MLFRSKDLPKSECGSTPDEAELNPAISVEKFNSPEHETADEKQAEMELEPHIAVSQIGRASCRERV